MVGLALRLAIQPEKFELGHVEFVGTSNLLHDIGYDNSDADEDDHDASPMHGNKKESVVRTIDHQSLSGFLVNNVAIGSPFQHEADNRGNQTAKTQCGTGGPLMGGIVAFAKLRVERKLNSRLEPNANIATRNPSPDQIIIFVSV